MDDSAAAPQDLPAATVLAALGSDRLANEFRKVVRLEPDGRFKVDMSYFSYDAFGMIRPFRQKFLDTFGPARKRDEPLTSHHHDLAFALQVTHETERQYIIRILIHDMVEIAGVIRFPIGPAQRLKL